MVPVKFDQDWPTGLGDILVQKYGGKGRTHGWTDRALLYYRLFSSGELMIYHMIIATDMALFFIRKMLISFLFLHENICCGYSLEAPH